MKRIFIVLNMLLFNCQTYAQSGLEFTATISPGYAAIINQADRTSSVNEAQASFGLTGQVTAGYNFSEVLGIATGVGVNYIRQNYIKTETKGILKAFHETSSRTLSYFRIPLLLRIGTNPDYKNSFFVRFGPHVDFLMTAIGQTKYPVDFNQQDEYIDYANLDASQNKYTEVFSPVVLGVSLEIGAKIGLTDELGLLLVAHIESSLTNVEANGAPAYFAAEKQFVTRNEQRLVVYQRSPTFNVLAGLSIGVVYNPMSYSIANKNYQRRRGRKFSRWR